MAEGLNRVMLLGNLGVDPELRFTQGGQAVLNLRLATTESYLDRDRVRRERTDWHSVVVWGKRGEALSKILHKGSSIFVEGTLRTSSYEARDGSGKRYKTEINARNILLTGGRGGGGGGGGGRYGSDEDRGGGGGRYDSQEDRGAPQDRGGPTNDGGGPTNDGGGPPGGDVPPDPGFPDDDDIPF